MGIFDKLFGKHQNEPKTFLINVLENGIEINNQYFQLPLNFSDFENLFGSEFEKIETENNFVYTWNDLGFKIFVTKTDKYITQLTVKTEQIDEAYLPKNVFNGELRLNNENYKNTVTIDNKDYLFKEIKVGNIRVVAHISEEDPRIIFAFAIAEIVKEQKKKKTSDKYKIKKISGEKIEFADFNFKLAIIEELMYNKELLKPKFDVYEFAEMHDIEGFSEIEGGYDPLPEVVEYFKTLEIDKKLAEHVTEIYQDGGNNIYMNVAPQWDGEDEIFHIHSYEDIKHFPNLKKMTLFCNDQKILEELKSKGIDAKTL